MLHAGRNGPAASHKDHNRNPRNAGFEVLVQGHLDRRWMIFDPTKALAPHGTPDLPAGIGEARPCAGPDDPPARGAPPSGLHHDMRAGGRLRPGLRHPRPISPARVAAAACRPPTVAPGQRHREPWSANGTPPPTARHIWMQADDVVIFSGTGTCIVRGWQDNVQAGNGSDPERSGGTCRGVAFCRVPDLHRRRLRLAKDARQSRDRGE